MKTRQHVIKRSKRIRPKTAAGNPKGDSRASRTLDWLKPRFIYFLLLVALGWSGYQLLNSPTFKINRISVLNNNLSPAQEIVEAAGLNDQNIFLINQSKAKESLMALPTVKVVELISHLPDEVTIRVSEHSPVYSWTTRAGSYLVSEEGVVIGTALAGQDSLIPILDLDNQDLRRGDHLDKGALNVARRLASILPKQVSFTPAHFEFSRSLGIAVPTDSYRIAFGFDDNLEIKVDELKAIINAINEKKIAPTTLIDLRVAGRPYLK